jgi:cyclic pyranopterin phosphate synthase
LNAPLQPGQIEDRIAGKRERVHILTGPVCNNNCTFCMEEDREGRVVTNSATTDEVVQRILAENPGCEEVCFTSGEPTVNPRLPQWVKWAKDAKVPRISMMTNGRTLSYEKYARILIAAGMNKFYVSIHGHTAKLHEALTRAPTSYEQTVGGLEMINRYKAHGLELHTSTVVTKQNLPHLGDIYRFLRGKGVDQVVFNVMQANGRANTHFDVLFPRYSEIAAVAKAFLDEQGQREARVQAFFVDIPLCTTTALPDFNRGYVESYVHYEPLASGAKLLGADEVAARSADGEIVGVTRSDLDDAQRTKRPECARCKYDGSCEGVWKNYLKRYGWDELQPVPSRG